MTAAERPATGATDADIEAALQRDIERERSLGWEPTNDSDWSIVRRSEIEDVAPILVPPGTVIALAEHVADAADRAAIGRALTLLRAVDKFATANSWDDIDDAVLDEFAEAARQAREEFTPDDRSRMERLSGEGERE